MAPAFDLLDLDDPDKILDTAARLTLRLALRCDWVEGCEAKDDDDPDSWNSLCDRIGVLMGAYANSPENAGEEPSTLMRHVAFHIARVIADIPNGDRRGILMLCRRFRAAC
jgi:hypothetical protein